MATQPVQGTFSGETYTDALLWGGWHWEDAAAAPGDPVVINYYLDTYQGKAWSATERDAIGRAFDTWSNVANITFVEVANSASAQLIERLVTEAKLPGTLGEHGTPDSAASTGDYDGSLLLGAYGQSYGYFNYQAFSAGGFISGGYDFVTFVHELGHGIGLAHPHDDGGGSGLFPGVSYNDSGDFGSNNLNQGIYTVMSYNDGWAAVQNPTGHGYTRYGFQTGPMAFDIAAIQYLYGGTTSHTGDDVYVLPGSFTPGTGWTCLWDTGGTDEIAYYGNLSARIDLRAATLDNTATGGGVVSFAQEAQGKYLIPGGYTIANGVIIENARGGNGNDTMTGNEYANVLSGSAGNDVLRGLGGSDTYDGGSGSDTAAFDWAGSFVSIDLSAGTIAGAAAGDVFVFASGLSTIENLIGSSYDDVLIGDASANSVYGGYGDDTIEGGYSNDTLTGGSNTAAGDTVSYEHVYAGVRVNLSLTKKQNTLSAGADTLKGFENATGSAFNDVLTGSKYGNVLDGGDGNDILSGGAGYDTLTGGAGGDVFMFNGPLRSGGVDIISDYEVGLDHIFLNDKDFARTGHRGFLNAAFFTTGPGAADANDHIIYDSTTGNLLYDSNGSRSGGVRIVAHLDAGLSLTASDFYIF